MTQFPNYLLNKPSGLQCNTEVTATPFCPEIHLNSDFQSVSLYDKKPGENFNNFTVQLIFFFLNFCFVFSDFAINRLIAKKTWTNDP